MISPWSVGRYKDGAQADAHRRLVLEADLAELNELGIDYMPVVFPGFSWGNLRSDASLLNEVPRRRGDFYWRQVYNAVDAGSTMVYGAMFDEVDEGTAMFKLAPTSAELPIDAQFLALDADGGEPLPSDWYLRLARAATEVLQGQRQLTEEIPISP